MRAPELCDLGPLLAEHCRSAVHPQASPPDWAGSRRSRQDALRVSPHIYNLSEAGVWHFRR
jgi:hypothetical protein